MCRTDLIALGRAVRFFDLHGAGALADVLDEVGDPRGPLLRRRWRRWSAARSRAEAGAGHADPDRVDLAFKKYIRSRFPDIAYAPWYDRR